MILSVSEFNIQNFEKKKIKNRKEKRKSQKIKIVQH